MIINGICRILTLITQRTWKLLFMRSQFRMKQSMNDFVLTISNYVSHSLGGKNHENTSLQLLIFLWQKNSVKLYWSGLLRSQICYVISPLSSFPFLCLCVCLSICLTYSVFYQRAENFNVISHKAF